MAYDQNGSDPGRQIIAAIAMQAQYALQVSDEINAAALRGECSPDAQSIDHRARKQSAHEPKRRVPDNRCHRFGELR
jgi:hypothetical protein